jgi:hypothetical protein
VADAAVDTAIRLKIEIAKAACDDASKQFDDYQKTFSALDGKAQNCATVSSLVVASFIAFIKPETIHALSAGYPKLSPWLLPLIGAVAIAPVFIAIATQRVMSVPTPFGALSQIREARHVSLFGSDEITDATVLDFYRNRLQFWKGGIEGLRTKVDSKATFVFVAQICSGLALIGLGCLLAGIVLVVAGAENPSTSETTVISQQTYQVTLGGHSGVSPEHVVKPGGAIKKPTVPCQKQSIAPQMSAANRDRQICIPCKCLETRGQ